MVCHAKWAAGHAICRGEHSSPAQSASEPSAPSGRHQRGTRAGQSSLDKHIVQDGEGGSPCRTSGHAGPPSASRCMLASASASHARLTTNPPSAGSTAQGARTVGSTRKQLGIYSEYLLAATADTIALLKCEARREPPSNSLHLGSSPAREEANAARRHAQNRRRLRAEKDMLGELTNGTLCTARRPQS